MTELGLLDLISDLQEYVMIASCLLCFWGFARLNSSERIIAYYLFFLLIINGVASLIADQRENNLATTHILVLGEFILLSSYFKELLGERFFLKKYYKMYLAVIGGFILFNSLFLEKITTFNTNAKTLVLFVIIFMTTSFFYDRSRQLMEVDKHEKAARTINAALLLYYSGSFFVYLFYKFTQDNMVFYSNKMLIFNASLYLLFALLMLLACSLILFSRKNQTS